MIGQHIRILKGGRWLHAVDCGDETVLHLVEDAPPPRVRRAYRPEFVAGAEAVEVVTHREPTFPAKEIVSRAYSRASDPALAAMFGDSESFVAWCTTGRLLASRNVALEVPGIGPVSARGVPAAPKGNGQVARAAGGDGTAKGGVKAAKAPVAKAPVRKAPAKKAGVKAAAGRPAQKARGAARAGVKAAAGRPAQKAKVAARAGAKGAAGRPAPKAKGAARAGVKGKGLKAKKVKKGRR